MIVASIRIAAASPTPISLKSRKERVAKIAKTATITAAALVTTPGGRLQAVGDGFLGRHAAIVRLADPGEDEHVVVHREPEEDDEEEQRQPGGDRPDRGEVEQAFQVPVLEDPDDHARRRRRPRAG